VPGVVVGTVLFAALLHASPFIAGSSLIHVLYCALLVEACRNADMSHAYPLIRGSAPLLVALAALLVGDRLGASQWCGVALICSGSLALLTSRRSRLVSLQDAFPQKVA
jgi:multidrug transporter EmrE-like cation transporter